MRLGWNDWTRARRLPFPGEKWQLSSPPKSGDATGTLGDEVAVGVEFRLNERYDAKGNHARDAMPRDLIDQWCTAKGVAFATEVLVELCKTPQRERPHSPGQRPQYTLRHDGQPWARLREHLALVSAKERAAAREVAMGARKSGNESRQGVAYAFCDSDWVEEDLVDAIKDGYGQLALLASLQNAEQARDAFTNLLGPTTPKYQVVEELYPHMPNLMLRLDDDDAELVVHAAKLAWNTSVRKPWLEIVACVSSPDARAFLAEHGYAAKPAKTEAKKRAKPARKATKKK